MAAPAPTAAIVVIGDEILAGTFRDENASYLIGLLREAGISLRRIEVIPDDHAAIAQAVTAASQAHTHVFTSGGVGPTHDDITVAAIAHGFGVPVVRHPDLEAKVRAYWGEALAPANLRLADVPEGTELVYGDDPRWPTWVFRNVYILPGVPTLFRRKIEALRPRLQGAAVHQAKIYLRGEEGALAPALDAVVAAHPMAKLGSYPRLGESDFSVMVTIEGTDRTAVQAAVVALCQACPTLVVRVEPEELAPPASSAENQVHATT